MPAASAICWTCAAELGEHSRYIRTGEHLCGECQIKEKDPGLQDLTEEDLASPKDGVASGDPPNRTSQGNPSTPAAAGAGVGVKRDSEGALKFYQQVRVLAQQA